MTTIPQRLTTVLAEETGVPIEEVIIIRDETYWLASAADICVAARRGGAVVSAAVPGSSQECLRFPRSTSVAALRASVTKARRMAQSAARKPDALGA